MRKGIIPTVLGTAVTGAALYSKIPDLNVKKLKKMDTETMLISGILGFGLANMVLGSIHLVKNK